MLPALVFLLGSLTGDSSIIGGTKVAIGDYPNVVFLTVDGQPWCTGTLISPTFVLTAAHCIDPNLAGYPDDATLAADVDVHFDVVNYFDQRDSNTLKTIAAKRILRGAFDPNRIGEHDIGLVELMVAAEDDREPARVNISPLSAPAVGTKGTMVGYGETLGGRGDGGVGFVIEDRISASCDDIVPALPGLDPPKDANLLCFAQTDNKGKCHGDSGGPTFALVGAVPMVVGVTSFGDRYCEIFGADTRTDVERDFILMNVPDVCVVEYCDGEGGDGGGCCDAGNGAGTSALGVGLVGFALRHRRRARS